MSSQGAVQINLIQFALIYLLLIIILIIMKKCHIHQTKLLAVASMRMTVQLILAGLILTYILNHPHPLFTVSYIAAMLIFSVVRVYRKSPGLNPRFKRIIFISMSFSGIAVLAYFVCAVIGKNFFDPQYTIPISGMVFGNAMTGMNLGLKTFFDSIKDNRDKVKVLTNLGATPQKILLPFVNNALETALLPTLNNMVGMGIIALPGMMTGQILSGTPPTTAILYQIAVMIAICTAVCLSVFCSLYFGYQTLYDDQNCIIVQE
ncbi:MAG: ABC transporter permease [Eubacteriaceae bacterium]|nr:ABC transporter permease [Eubacteriaceae bacterium]MDD4508001.1 ABC transporter permease [Eubacteriaceae bacterium]